MSKCTRRTLTLSLMAVATSLVLAGCSSGNKGEESGQATSPGPVTSMVAPEGPAALTTASSNLGDIIVNANGMTVYMFDHDAQGSGASSCTGDCLAEWPPVTTDSDVPPVVGVTGLVGTIPGPNGSKQITVNGWPIYLFAEDGVPGDLKGQGDDGVWWVLNPAGAKVMTGR